MSFIFSPFGSGCGRRIIVRIDSSPCDQFNRLLIYPLVDPKNRQMQISRRTNSIWQLTSHQLLLHFSEPQWESAVVSNCRHIVQCYVDHKQLMIPVGKLLNYVFSSSMYANYNVCYLCKTHNVRSLPLITSFDEMV